MKRFLIKAAGAATVALALFGAYWLGARQSRPACEIRRSPLDSQTIEVWRNGELADEWQPEDGAIYTMLAHVLRDEMPPEAEQRARDRLNGRSQPQQPPNETAPVAEIGQIHTEHWQGFSSSRTTRSRKRWRPSLGNWKARCKAPARGKRCVWSSVAALRLHR